METHVLVVKEYYFTVSPNPATNEIKIGTANKPAPIVCKSLKAISSPKGIIFSEINIYNNLGILVKSYKTKDAKEAIIQISDLIAGSYQVEIKQTDYLEKHYVIVRK